MLKTDPARANVPETGIVVRAHDANGRWAPVDIAHLDAASLEEWLDSDQNLARNVVMFLLGHPR